MTDEASKRVETSDDELNDGSAGKFAATGWIVTALRMNGRSAKRHFLVAMEKEDAAIATAQKALGDAFKVELGGPASSIHFRRRGMTVGEVLMLGNDRPAKLED